MAILSSTETAILKLVTLRQFQRMETFPEALKGLSDEVERFGRIWVSMTPETREKAMKEAGIVL